MYIRELIGLSRREAQKGLLVDAPCRVLGIDLGTTNSTLAEICFDPDAENELVVRCLPVEQQTASRSYWSPLVPSLVALYDGQEVVGEGARQLREQGREKGLIEQGSLFSCVKNDMGLKRTYHMAPSGYRSAAEISGRILKFLQDAARKEKSQSPLHTTITVPASFQAAQRDDTIKAAQLAGLNVKDVDLLDEPIAALISYLARNDDLYEMAIDDPLTMLVFDFGGGTCDVAIIHLEPNDGRVSFSPLAVSRYHRLGGYDIDQAIFYEVLLPQILEQNNLTTFDLDYECKKSFLEPAFIGIAEQLKIKVCEKLKRAENLSEKVQQILPEDIECRLPDGRRLILENPSLTSDQLSTVLKPFLDPYALFARETEYRQTLSIFAPIIDALERCELKQEDIIGCLLVGGSCLNPYIQAAVENWFSDSVELLAKVDSVFRI
jgi:molecular chaperone DnaK (HSP70)